MVEVLTNNKGAFCLHCVSVEDDLRLHPGVNINPPPSDGKCECCGRHMHGIKPFGKAGDPLIGDFEGTLLLKIFRNEGPYDKSALHSIKELGGGNDLFALMIAKYGVHKGKDIYYRALASAIVVPSWECRNCVVLSDDEYFKKIKPRKFARLIIAKDQLGGMKELYEGIIFGRIVKENICMFNDETGSKIQISVYGIHARNRFLFSENIPYLKRKENTKIELNQNVH